MALVRAAMQAQPQQLEAAIEHANAAAEVLNGVEGEKALAKVCARACFASAALPACCR